MSGNATHPATYDQRTSDRSCEDFTALAFIGPPGGYWLSKRRKMDDRQLGFSFPAYEAVL